MAVKERCFYVPEQEKEAVACHGSVLTPDQHYADFRLEAGRALDNELVYAQTMAFGIPESQNGIVATDFAATKMYEAFKTAPKNAPKRYRIDWYTTLMTESGEPIELLKLLPWNKKRIQSIMADQDKAFKKLEDIGVDIELTNPPQGLQKFIPVLGRNHMKCSGIGDRVFYIRGFNDLEPNTGSLDFAVKFVGESAGRLRVGFEESDKDSNKDNVSEIDEETRLIIDRGIPGQSKIYDTILQNIQDATRSIKAMSPYTPEGKAAKLLAMKQNNNAKVEIFSSSIHPNFSRPVCFENLRYLTGLANNAYLRINGVHLPVNYNQIRDVHGKCWIFDNKTAIFGTHNASEQGVMAGTREATIITTNRQIVEGLLNLFSQARIESYPNIQDVL